MIKFALAGNPNSGKTTLFNALTGSTAHVGNWPGVTVDKKEGVYKKCKEPVQIVDLPGIYSLSPYTPEEVIARNFILDGKPEAVINIVDATNLERNLYLTTQLMEMDVPVIVALNMSDELKRDRKEINTKILEDVLGIPVVLISALKGENIKTLMDVAYKASQEKRLGRSILEGSRVKDLINKVKESYIEIEATNPLFHAVKLIENDEIEVNSHAKLYKVIDEFKKTFKDDVFGDDLEAVMADERYKYISANCSKAITQHEKEKLGVDKKGKQKKRKLKDEDGLTRSDRVDRILTNKWLGIPIFLVVLFLIFHLIFSEDFLYLSSIWGVDLGTCFAESEYFAGTFYDGALFSPGVMIMNIVANSLGALQGVIVGGIEGAGALPWAVGLIGDGILGGIFAVIGFLPQILLLFLAFSIMEDTGYMARVAFILDRIFRRFGISGRAFMPMIMGFGCSIPAMANTRTLADEKERVATIRVIPFFSCGAKLPILAGIAGGIAQLIGMPNPDLITYGMYLLGMVVAIVAVILMRSTTLRGEVAPFIMELPTYRVPQFKSLMIHLWDKTKHFVKKAFTIILASTIIIWVLTNFNFSYEYLLRPALDAAGNVILDDAGEVVNIVYADESILAGFSKLFQPLFTPMGFGSQLTGSYTWIFVAAAVFGLVAKENVISLFGILGAMAAHNPALAEEAASDAAISAIINATEIGVPGLIAFIAFNLTTIPCFAAVATAKAELRKGTLKWTILFWLATSFVVSTIVYVTGIAWWTIFIWLAVAAGVIYLVYLYNKKRPIKPNTPLGA